MNQPKRMAAIKKNKMEKIEQKLKGINEIEFPGGLHGKIVRSVVMRSYRWQFLAVLSVVVFNIGISGLRLHASISQNGAIQAFGSFFKNFGMDYDFTSDFMKLIADYIPLHSFSIFLVNFIFAGYVAKLYFDVAKYDGHVERSNK